MSSLAASPRASTSFDPTPHAPHSQVHTFHTTSTGPQPGTSIPQPPALSASGQRSPMLGLSPSAASMGNGGYFGLSVDNADAALGEHSLKNWSPSGSSIRSTAARSPLPVHVDNPSTPFQRQSEALAMKISMPTGARRGMGLAIPGRLNLAHGVTSGDGKQIDNDYFSSPPINHSPSLELSQRETLPQMTAGLLRTNSYPLSLSPGGSRSVAPKHPPKEGEPILIEPAQLHEFLSRSQMSLLLLDVRTYKAFSESRIVSAVNLCIPTTLLKRPSFNVAKLSETFASDQDKQRFSQWSTMEHIVVYDADSQDLSDSSGMTALHTLSKFSREGWKGRAYVLKGKYFLRV